MHTILKLFNKLIVSRALVPVLFRVTWNRMMFLEIYGPSVSRQRAHQVQEGSWRAALSNGMIEHR